MSPTAHSSSRHNSCSLGDLQVISRFGLLAAYCLDVLYSASSNQSSSYVSQERSLCTVLILSISLHAIYVVLLLQQGELALLSLSQLRRIDETLPHLLSSLCRDFSCCGGRILRIQIHSQTLPPAALSSRSRMARPRP